MPVFVVIVEYVGVRHRHVASTCIWFSTASGFLLMAAMAYGIPNWRYSTVVSSAIGLPSILFWWYVGIILNTITITITTTTATTTTILLLL